MPEKDAYIETTALLSKCETYRYTLTRRWASESPQADFLDKPLMRKRNPCGKVTFVMLNPSTADGTEDDPTIRRCVGFAKTLGAAGLEVVNLFAYRATKPVELEGATDPIGPENDFWIAKAVEQANCVVVAWGATPIAGPRADKVKHLIRREIGRSMWCLGVTKDGQPKHPLYIAADTKLQHFPVQGETRRNGISISC